MKKCWKGSVSPIIETVYDSTSNNDNKMMTADSYSKLEPKGV